MQSRHFGFHPYRSSINRSFCKHLQDMPVKVADRYGTGLCRCKPNRFSWYLN